MGSDSNVPRVPKPPTMFAPPAGEIDTGVLDIALSRRGGQQPQRTGYITKGQTVGESGQLVQAPKREMASAKEAVGQAAFSKKEELKSLEEFNPAGFSQAVSMYNSKQREKAADYLRNYEKGNKDPFTRTGRTARAQKYRERQEYKSNLLNQYNAYVAEYNKQQAQRKQQQAEL